MSQPYSSTLIIDTAIEAYARGYTPVPIRAGAKRPAGVGWQHTSYANVDEVREEFTDHDGGVGLALGDSSAGLVDVDLDHPKARRAAELVLPPTPMQSGRPSSRWSHRWYVVTGEMPDTRRYANHLGEVTVELRSNGAQTVIPPSMHPDSERYLWEGEAWGGKSGPTRIDGKVLAARVATLAMVSTLLEVWPAQGSRHDAYLALVGGLARTRQGIHPLWETTAAQIVGVIAEASGDEDGADVRVAEAVPTTLEKIRADRAASGWPTLEGIIGEPAVATVRRIARDIEHLLGWGSRAEPTATTLDVAGPSLDAEEVETNDAPRSPLEERSSTWEPVDLGPYLAGDIETPNAGLLFREDGEGLFYEGRVNMLYARRESGKSWVTLGVSAQCIRAGERVLYVDLEDEPDTTIARLRALGLTDDEIRKGFVYLHPEDPLTAMSPLRYGETSTDEARQVNDRALHEALDSVEPTVVVVDGMTVLYALHGLSSNDSVETDRVSGWLRSLTRRGRSSVILVDHVRKGAGRSDDPIGSQHKMAMISGAAYHAWPDTPLRIGARGRIELVVGKDRLGAIRKFAMPDGAVEIAAVIELDSNEDGSSVGLTVHAPSPRDKTAVEVDADGDAIERAEKRNANDRERDRQDRIALEIIEGRDPQSLAEWDHYGASTGAQSRTLRDAYVIKVDVEGTNAKQPILTEKGFARLEALRQRSDLS